MGTNGHGWYRANVFFTMGGVSAVVRRRLSVGDASGLTGVTYWS